MGMMDVGSYGSSFYETPQIGRLAQSAMKLNFGYASCAVCSPTRASIMTGRHPVRLDITDWIPELPNKKANKLIQPEDRENLALEEVTIAEKLQTHHTPLRAGKGWLYEGGIREPTIVCAPNVTKPGSVCNDPIVSMDFFPTMLELAGLPLRPKLHRDGRSLLPELTGKKVKQDLFSGTIHTITDQPGYRVPRFGTATGS